MSNFSRAILLVLTLAVSLPSSAQGALGQLLQPSKPANSSSTTSADSLGRETPYGTVYGFLQEAEKGNYGIAAQYLQMSSARRQSEGEAVAEKLKEVMDRTYSGTLGSKLPEGAPQEGEPAGRQKLGTMSSGDAEADLTLVRVSDPNAGKIWLISADTLEKLPELYDQVKARKVETRLPAWIVKHQFAGMPLWQWFALILLIPVAAGAGWLLAGDLPDSRALVGAKKWRARCGAVAFGVRAGVAARRHRNPSRPCGLFRGCRCCNAATMYRSPPSPSLSARTGFSGA